MSEEFGEAATGVGGLNIVSQESHETLPSDGDAADFLLSNPKYHDCFLTVGNPECEKVEKIGVTSVDLIAHSPVLREMLVNYKQTDLAQAEMKITDVSPAMFKLMLRFVYGGKLPNMTSIETAGLALCADKYKIPRLVQKSLKRLVPSGAEDVFPALICVTFASFPDLEVQVSKIIQQKTDKVVQNTDFLKLDENCVLFILKQDTLNIDELELWKHLVRWGEHQAGINPGRAVRDCLARILGHVRFLILTIEDILEHVLPTKILTSDEFMDLTLALTRKETLVSPLLCKIQERRNMYKEEAIAILEVGFAKEKHLALLEVDDAEGKTKDDERALQDKPVTATFSRLDKLKISDYYDFNNVVYSHSSTLSIKPADFIEIVAFICQGKDQSKPNNQFCTSCGGRGDQTNNWSYEFSCYITVTKTNNDGLVSERMIKIMDVGLYDGNICLDIRDCLLEEGKPSLILSPDATWTFSLDFNFALPLFKVSNPIVPVDTDTPLKMDNIELKLDQCSVLEIDYMKQ